MLKQIESLEAQIAKLQQQKQQILDKYQAYAELAARSKKVIAEVNEAVAKSGLDKTEFYQYCGLPVVKNKAGGGAKRKQPQKRYKDPAGGADIVCSRLTKELIDYKNQHGQEALDALRID